MEEDIHHQNSPKVHRSMNGDVPHLSFFTSQVRVVSLRKLEGSVHLLNQSGSYEK